MDSIKLHIDHTLATLGDDTFFDALSAGDLLRYGRVSSSARASIEAYIRRKFRLQRVLSKFLSAEQTDELRVLMSKTSMFISGSVALQFFNRCLYPYCDLDLYLSVRDVEQVSEWLCSVGYQFDPFRFDTDQDAVYTACRGMRPPKSGLVSSKPRGYELADFVLTFYKHTPEERVTIQLVASVRSHVELVLRFHSTCVMNIITHNQAYCLFPRATLDEHRAMSYLCPHSRFDEFEAGLYAKYTSRGFDLLHVMPEDLDPVHGSFPVGNRFIGDEKCWTLPILPQRTDLPHSTLDTNSFHFHAGPRMVPMVEYQHLHLPRLTHRYVFAPDEGARLWKCLRLVKRAPANLVPDSEVDMKLRDFMRSLRASLSK